MNTILFLFFMLLFILVMLLLSRWQARRSFATMTLAIYLLFFGYACAGEFEQMHPYGTDHRNEGDED